MKVYNPIFWGKKSLLAYLLLPLSLITFFINQSKKMLIKKKFKIKTICVGNIYLGGTGKTSLAIEIYKILSSNKISMQINNIGELSKNLIIDLKELNKSETSNFYSIKILEQGIIENTMSHINNLLNDKIK